MQTNKLVDSGTKDFVVAAKSTKANSFGLRGHILVARDGETIEIGLNYMYEKEKGDVVHARYAVYENGARLVDFIGINGELQTTKCGPIPADKITADQREMLDAFWAEAKQ